MDPEILQRMEEIFRRRPFSTNKGLMDINPDGISHELRCVQCFKVPLQPKFSPTHKHLCCASSSCTTTEEYNCIRISGPLTIYKRYALYKAWTEIHVQCKMCFWNGPIEEYLPHITNCTASCQIECSICLEVMTLCREPQITPCKHVFCKTCIQNALNQLGSSCPYCRSYCKIDSLNDFEHYECFPAKKYPKPPIQRAIASFFRRVIPFLPSHG